LLLQRINMAIFRQYILPFLIVLLFGVALLAVSARIFLPEDMAAPAPISEIELDKPMAIDLDAGVSKLKAPTLPTSANSLP
jgi:hypothetical protein